MSKEKEVTVGFSVSLIEHNPCEAFGSELECWSLNEGGEDDIEIWLDDDCKVINLFKKPYKQIFESKKWLLREDSEIKEDKICTIESLRGSVKELEDILSSYKKAIKVLEGGLG